MLHGSPYKKYPEQLHYKKNRKQDAWFLGGRERGMGSYCPTDVQV